MDHNIAWDVGHWHIVAAESTFVFGQTVDGVDEVGPAARRDGKLVAVHAPSEAVVFGHAVVVGQTSPVFIHCEEHILRGHILTIHGHTLHLPSADKHLDVVIVAIAGVFGAFVFGLAGDHCRHRECDHQN